MVWIYLHAKSERSLKIFACYKELAKNFSFLFWMPNKKIKHNYKWNLRPRILFSSPFKFMSTPLNLNSYQIPSFITDAKIPMSILKWGMTPCHIYLDYQYLDSQSPTLGHWQHLPMLISAEEYQPPLNYIPYILITPYFGVISNLLFSDSLWARTELILETDT